MQLCYGVCRKLSALPILLFIAGWGVGLVGFVRRMIRPSALLPRLDNYPAMVAVGAGPVFVVTALLHACLNGGTAGAAMGSVAAVAAAVYLVSAGNSTITSAETLYRANRSLLLYNNDTSEAMGVFYVSTTLAGSVLCCLAITLLLSMWGCYQATPPQRDDAEEGERFVITNGGQSARGLRKRCWQHLFPGRARKMALPCLLLSFLGWCLMVGGHHHRIDSTPQEGHYRSKDGVLVFDFGQWGACVLTPLLLLFALVHAASTGAAGTVMGVVNATLNGIVLNSIGYYMVHDVGGWLKAACRNKCDYTLPQNAAALCELVGSFVVCFFWASVLGLWPFYSNCPKPTETAIQHRINPDYHQLDQDGDEEAMNL